MILVERHIVTKGKKQFKTMDSLCFFSKNLYNAALYYIRQEYFSSGRIIRYQELEKHFKQTNQIDYRALPINTSQQTLLLLDKNVNAYFGLLKKMDTKPIFPPSLSPLSPLQAQNQRTKCGDFHLSTGKD
jgi:hypothetical protein